MAGYKRSGPDHYTYGVGGGDYVAPTRRQGMSVLNDKELADAKKYWHGESFQALFDTIDHLRQERADAIKAAEEAQDTECIKDVVRLIRNCAKDVTNSKAAFSLRIMADAIEQEPRGKDASDALDRALAAERERCAKIAEQHLEARPNCCGYTCGDSRLQVTAPDKCLHLTLKKQADDSPAQQLHQGPEKAYYCHECGSTFFLKLEAAQIKVIYPTG